MRVNTEGKHSSIATQERSSV